MPDPFSSLPSPLPLMILKQLEDFRTVHYLLRASPAAAAIFENYDCEITEVILGDLVPSLQRLPRLIVLIRSKPTSLRAQCDSVEVFEEFRKTVLFNADVGSSPLTPSTAKHAAIRSLVATGSHVQCLSTCFFETNIEWLNEIEPYCSKNAWPVQPWKRVPGPEHTPYKIMRCYAPSWIEEQRVHRALWRIALYFDLRTITGLHVGQDPTLSYISAKQGPRIVWYRGYQRFREAPRITFPSWEVQEIDTVFEFLSERSISELQNLPYIQSESFGVLQRMPVANTEAAQWQQLSSDLQDPGPGFEYLRSKERELSFLNDNDGYQIASPREEEDFNPLRRLCMCIWDKEKLARLGLADFREMSPEIY